jgi:hypothetical protein
MVPNPLDIVGKREINNRHPRLVRDERIKTRDCSSWSRGCARTVTITALAVAVLATSMVDRASAQSSAALPQSQAPAQAAVSVKPMTPQRLAWLKDRCAQLVAYYDYYGAGRSENTDGARNPKRIGAVIECAKSDYRHGIDAMAGLLAQKAFEVPKPGAPAVEPEDGEAPDITNPTRPWYW